MIINSRGARVKAMKITRYLFLFFAVTSAYVSDGAATFLGTLQNLSLPEKIILPVIPLGVPIIATTYDYYTKHYEPKTVETLEDMLRQVKKRADPSPEEMALK